MNKTFQQETSNLNMKSLIKMSFFPSPLKKQNKLCQLCSEGLAATGYHTVGEAL